MVTRSSGVIYSTLWRPRTLSVPVGSHVPRDDRALYLARPAGDSRARALFVAALQGLIGGIGLLVAGIPNPVFRAFLILLFALLPLIGAFFVWAPAATYLLLIDNTVTGIFLGVYGVLVVNTIDNYARPLVIDREAHLNPAVVLVGVFGGVFAIGVTGLFIGPLVIAVLVATLASFDEAFDEEFDESGERVS